MPVKDCKTEQLIKDTAKHLFLTEGKMLATTQDIADAAGVIRTLLHYYFRSREALFNQVAVEAYTELRDKLQLVMASPKPFREKIEVLVDTFLETLLQAPYLQAFIVLQLNQEPSRYEELFVHIPGGMERVQAFLSEIQAEMDKGTIIANSPLHFFMNMFALISYPMIAKPIYQNMFGLSDAAFTQLLGERREVILSLLFK